MNYLVRMAPPLISRELIDIGANLTDSMFQGMYNKSKKHECDLEIVLERARKAGVGKIIATSGNLDETKATIGIAEVHPAYVFNTVGCHPTRCSEIADGEQYFGDLLRLAINHPTIIAVGECGLDYDRLQFCDKDTQKKYFERHFEITEATGLPMFIHCRNAADDLTDILLNNHNRWKNGGGVVHSFDGTAEDAKRILELGLYIGINGCSLKTESNLEVLKSIPQERLMVETDSPWCEIRPTHAGFKHLSTIYPSKKKEKWSNDCQVKGRNEPANLIQVVEVMAKVRNEDINSLAEALYQNTMRIFFPKLL